MILSKTIFKGVVEEQKLNTLIDKSQVELLTITSTFPFDLFPDTLRIDITQIHITIKEFFKSQRIHSIAIQDISDVFVDTSPWYASLRIAYKGLIEKSIKISFLKRNDALKAKKIIHGLMIGIKEGIDFSKLVNNDQLIEKLEDLGSPSPKSK